MARPLRIEYPGAVYHVTSRGNAGNEIFIDDEDRRNFLVTFRSVVKRYHWVCHAYCLMDNHYHLLIETPEGDLSQGIRGLNGIYTQRFNRKHGRVGYLFQGRFKAIVVEKEGYLLELCRYVVLNPVRVNRVRRPELWEWSSYAATAGIRRVPDFLRVDWLLAEFDKERKKAEKGYREFIRGGITEDSPWRNITGQVFLGSQRFVQRLQILLADSQEIAEIPRVQRYATRPSLKDLFSRKDSWNRNEMDRRIHESHVSFGYTLKEIAAHLGIHYTSASRAVKRMEEKK